MKYNRHCKKQHFAEFLGIARMTLKKTQKEMAFMLGISLKTYGEFERGETIPGNYKRIMYREMVKEHMQCYSKAI
jgi:DNA-binding XRE family transcriptional regulator